MQFQNNKVLIFISSFFLASFTTALHCENLYDVYNLATSQDAEYLAAQANYQAEIQARPIARSNLLPQIDLSANVSDVEQKTDGQTFGVQGRDVDFNEHGYTLDITQMLYNREFYIQLKQAKNTVAKAKIELDAAKQDLIVRVSTAYFNLLSAQDSLDFALAEKDAISKQLQQAQSRYEVGINSISDVAEAQASYDLSVAQQIEAENNLELAKDELEKITNQRIETASTLSDRTRFALPQPNNMDNWIDTALMHNLNLLANEYVTKIAQQDIQLEKAKRLPTFDIVASYSDFDTGGLSGSREFEETRIGIELNMPLFQGGRTHYKATEAKFRHENLSQEHENQRREVIRTTRGAYLNVVAGISRIKALKQALESTETATEAVSAGFDAGTRTSVDVLLALRETYLAKSNYSRAKYDYLVNTLHLKQAAGNLSADDLIQLNNWLN